MTEETSIPSPKDVQADVWIDLVNNTMLYGTGFLQMRRTDDGRLQVRILPPEEYLDMSALEPPAQKGESDDH